VRVLLVDNYDSFTWNLAQLVAAITGEPPEVVRNDERSVDELLAARPDAILLSPGPGSSEVASDVGVCRALVERAGDVPLLGVCLGHQAIGVALGGRAVHAPEPMHGRRSAIHHAGDGIFRGLPSPLAAVRYHSLVLDRARLPPSLAVTATTDDGLVMGIAHRTRPLFGVQFHPESILTDGGRELLANFLALARPRSSTAIARSKRSTRTPAPSAREVRRELPWIDPEHAFVALFADSPRAFWLDGNGRFARMGEGGGETIRVRRARVELHGTVGTQAYEGDPFAIVDGSIEARRTDRAPGAAAVMTGWVGWLGYELKEFAGGDPGPRDERALPDAALMLADRVLEFDREERRLVLACRLAPDEPDAIAEGWFDAVAERLRAGPAPPEPRRSSLPPPVLRSDRDRARYLDDVARIQRLLRDGEAYEACLTTQWRAERRPGDVDPLDLYRVLRRVNPSPHSCFLRFEEACVLSSSPERFVRIDEDGAIESRPIKGTRRRGSTPDEDERARAALAASEKDRAENLMIVDLVRNDLGRVCATGSVQVPSLMAIEPHPTVLQMVSTVRGRLDGGVGAMEAVRALFPGGSMTGAPKLRAMRILGELEARPRGIYAGGIGFVSFAGAVDLAMAIRTIVVTASELSFGVGGAITVLSDPAAEWDEALAKGAALERAIALVYQGRSRTGAPGPSR